MKHFTLILAGAMVVALTAPAFAQRAHPSPKWTAIRVLADGLRGMDRGRTLTLA